MKAMPWYNDTTYKYDILKLEIRDRHELELDFKRFWEEFRSSNSEKEKEVALDQTVDALCRFTKQHINTAWLFTM